MSPIRSATTALALFMMSLAGLPVWASAPAGGVCSPSTVSMPAGMACDMGVHCSMSCCVARAAVALPDLRTIASPRVRARRLLRGASVTVARAAWAPRCHCVRPTHAPPSSANRNGVTQAPQMAVRHSTHFILRLQTAVPCIVIDCIRPLYLGSPPALRAPPPSA